MASQEVDQITSVLARRLPSLPATERQRIAEAYLAGAQQHAVERTIGTGSVPTGLSGERAELLACVCRALGRLLTEDEIAALLRVIPNTARSVQKTMLAAFDDLPLLSFKAAFDGAKRDGRGTQGDITNGYRVKFSKGEKMDMARVELERRGLMCEVLESKGTRHLMLVDSSFDIDSVLPGCFMDATAKQAKDLLDLVGTPSALIGGTLLAFASRGIKENLAKVDRTKMLFAFLAGLAAMGVAGSLVALMAPIGWRAISSSDHGGATLVVFWMILLSIAGSFIYATLITKRCIDELRRPSH